MPIDLAQDHMPARLSIGDHAADTLDIVEFLGQRFRRDGVERQPTFFEKLVDLRTCLLFGRRATLGRGFWRAASLQRAQAVAQDRSLPRPGEG
jgi:hypothetical protein